jgi:DNA-binding NarL/FixJ family response regulator
VLEIAEAGADGYLMKHRSSEIILTSIERAARGDGGLSAEVTGGVVHVAYQATAAGEDTAT